MKAKRILLLHISEVSGHKKATLAVENALKAFSPDCEIMNINAFNYTTHIIEKIVDSLYMSILKRAPAIWDYLYDNPKVVKSLQKFKTLVHNHNTPKLKRLYDEFKPDVVVCTQAYPCGMISDLKRSYNLNLPIVAVLTDYIAHSFWIYDNVDYYICPDEVVKRTLIQKGISEERIEPLGIPIDPKFSKPHDIKNIFNKLGLEEEKPTVLIMGGGHGLGPIKTLVRSFAHSTNLLQLIVVAGNNKKLLKWLQKRKGRLIHKTLIYGFTDNIEELMSISDLIITKPGGITTAEALAMQLPMLIVEPLPGQEEYNTQHLLAIKAGIRIRDLKKVAGVVDALIVNKTVLKNLSIAAKNAAHPKAAEEIAKLIINI